ncbi:MAG: pirin family protein [Proteobacteria bacterium]|nr:pirin family protein [Pseudomonadota bacterium]
MIKIRRADERGHADHGWLDTYHTFSFGTYYAPEHNGFRALRVINEDRVAPGNGFGTHPHANMEILSYVIKGALAHSDSTGNGTVIRKGEVQRMSAGTGITHSEKNSSESEEVHFLQIWITPEKENLTPGYDQIEYAGLCTENELCLIASRDGRAGSLSIHQDVDLYTCTLGCGERCNYLAKKKNRHQWIQVVSGNLSVNGHALGPGDGCAVSEEELEMEVPEEADEPESEFLLIDLA